MSWFIILGLLVNTLTVIFLVFVSVYFYSSAQLKFPSTTESWIAFWISIMLAMICLLLGIWAVFKLLPSVPISTTVIGNVPVTRQIPLAANLSGADRPVVAIPPPMYR